MNLQILAAAILITAAASFGAGWKVHSWKTDSETKAAVEAAAIVEKKISKTLEDKLAELKANEKVIEHEKTTIIERPVYRNTCLDSDGLRLANSAKSGTGKPAR